MILQARVVRKPRKYYECDECEFTITGEHLYLYGMPDVGDKPYALRLHLDHAPFYDPKIVAEIDRYKKKWAEERGPGPVAKGGKEGDSLHP